jgi:hypothetical protein
MTNGLMESILRSFLICIATGAGIGLATHMTLYTTVPLGRTLAVGMAYGALALGLPGAIVAFVAWLWRGRVPAHAPSLVEMVATAMGGIAGGLAAGWVAFAITAVAGAAAYFSKSVNDSLSGLTMIQMDVFVGALVAAGAGAGMFQGKVAGLLLSSIFRSAVPQGGMGR